MLGFETTLLKIGYFAFNFILIQIRGYPKLEFNFFHHKIFVFGIKICGCRYCGLILGLMLISVSVIDYHFNVLAFTFSYGYVLVSEDSALGAADIMQWRKLLKECDLH